MSTGLSRCESASFEPISDVRGHVETLHSDPVRHFFSRPHPSHADERAAHLLLEALLLEALSAAVTPCYTYSQTVLRSEDA